MKKNLIRAMLIIVSFVMILPTSVIAEDFSSEIRLTIEPTLLSVIVPATLPLELKANGKIVVADSAQIVNNSKGPVKISAVSVELENPEWEIVPFSTDFTTKQFGTQEIALKFNGDEVLIDGSVPLTTSEWPSIDGETSLNIDYDGKLSAQSVEILDTSIATVYFVIGWDNAGTAILSENDLDSTAFVSGETKILKLEYDYIDSNTDTVTWSTSNPSVATVADYIPETRSTLLSGRQFCEVTAIDKGTATITGTLPDGTFASYNATVAGKMVDHLEVKTSPTRTSYVEGDSFDKTGLVLIAHYNDETSIETTDFTIPNGSSLLSTQTSVIINYEDKAISIPITVVKKQVTSISISKAPDKIAYIEGNNFDDTGMIVIATYNNGSSEEVFDYTTPDSANLPIGKTSITVTHSGKSVSQPITVAAKSLSSIAVTTQPNKRIYVEGNNFDKTGMVVMAYYNNGTSGNITGYTVSNGTALAAGQLSVTINYNGISTTQPISVAAKSISSIAITTPPTKTAYIEGNNFSSTGMVVTASYNNGTSAAISGYTISNGTALTVGQNLVTINYGGKSATQAISVTAKSLSSIFVATAPTKIAYIEGESFNSSGMVISANYNNGTSGNIADYTISNGARLTVGQTSVTINYGGKSITQPISVVAKSLSSISVTKAPTKVAYIEGNNFDSTGMVVTASYNNGTSAAITGYTISNGTALTVGQSSVSINYGGKSTTQVISVAAKTVSSISVTTPPTKTVYLEGENFANAGMVVRVSYNNGTSADISDYTIGNGTLLTVATKTINITYKGASTTTAVTVTEIPIGTKKIIGDYEYSYKQRIDESNDDLPFWIDNSELGWGVKVVDLTKSSYSSPETSIMGKPVVSMANLFYNTTSPTITLVDFKTSNVTDMQSMFGISASTTINGLESFDTSKVTSMYQMFVFSSIKSLNLSSFNTSKVTNMMSMFYGSEATTITGLKNFNTSSVTTMDKMFCQNKATSLDLSSFDVRKVTSMTNMFWNSKATSINLDSFVTSSLLTANGMFSNTVATTITAPKFDTSKATTLERMFFETRITALDLSSFDFTSIGNVKSMFYNSTVKTILAKTQADADKIKATTSFPVGITVTVKS